MPSVGKSDTDIICHDDRAEFTHSGWLASLELIGRLLRSGLASGRQPPHGVANVIGDQQCAAAVDCQTNRPTARMVVRIEKARNHVLRRPAGLSAAERNEDDLVAI